MNMAWVYFILYIILQPFGQMLVKMGVNNSGEISSLLDLIKLVKNPFVISGVGLMVAGLSMFILLLSKYELSYIQPLGALSYIIVALIGFYFLKENISFLRWSGIMLIVAGAFLMNLKGV